ncbi:MULTISPECIES: RNA pyrophosphohydrolase [Rhodomicrobium]|uniref:RNA pyrophosphohydrolase n=1 Tax=Rhodomicrobium TaxID=1068 RepID=UPI000B4A5C2E|nr:MULTISPECIES: RNA pyrophosphohydrolase [Rhodomicrobium]
MSDETVYAASNLPYRAGVGIMLINADGLVWVGRRRQDVMEAGENWQMPQGGIDEGEAPAAAALRELAEETGTDKAEIIAETALWLHYDLPAEVVGIALKGKYRGQRQKWYAMRFTGADEDFNIHAPPGGHIPEFEAWRWIAADELPGLIVPFKRNIYEAVIEEFRSLLAR